MKHNPPRTGFLAVERSEPPALQYCRIRILNQSSRQIVLALLASILTLYVPGQCPAKDTKNLKTQGLDDWQIVIGKNAIPSEKYAAAEFRQFLNQTTGIQLESQTESSNKSNNIFIGPSDSLKKSPLGFTMKRKYGHEELRIVIRSDNIAILGGRPRGTLYGVYTFLEDYLGVRFLTAEVTHAPKVAVDHTFPVIDRSYKPPFEYRFYLKTEVMKDPVFAVRRRQNAASRHGPPEQRFSEKLGGEATGGVFLHNNFHLSASFNEHPEYFSWRDGKRTSHQPCLTHPEVRLIVTQQILSNLKGYAPGSTIPLAQNDNGNPCLCDRCAAVQREGDAPGSFPIPKQPLGVSAKNIQNGPPSAVIVDFVNHVANEVAKKRPDLWIGTEAYAYSMMPPRKTKVRPNVKVQVANYHGSIIYAFEDKRSPTNQQFLRYLNGWGKLCDNVFIWAYDMNPRDYWLPFPNMRSQPEHLRTFVRSNGRGIFMQGSAENTEFSDLRAYVMTSLIWDPSCDANQLISEFLDLYYGKAAPSIREWIKVFHDQAVASGQESNINATARDYGLDAKLGEKGMKLFEQAMQLAEDDTKRLRVEKVSMTALRLALEPPWWNVVEAPFRSKILKTPLEKERVAIDDKDLPRYRQMARRLFALAKKHKMHGREGIRKQLFSYLGIPQESPAR